MDLDKELENGSIAGSGGIEGDLDRLCVGSMIAVGGITDVAARIPDARRNHARIAADQILHSPKASSGKDCTLGRWCHALPPRSLVGGPTKWPVWPSTKPLASS